MKTSSGPDLSDEKRAEIGQNLINFCGNVSIVLGSPDVDDDQDQETEVSEAEAKNIIDKENKGQQGEEDGNTQGTYYYFFNGLKFAGKLRGIIYTMSCRIIKNCT